MMEIASTTFQASDVIVETPDRALAIGRLSAGDGRDSAGDGARVPILRGACRGAGLPVAVPEHCDCV